MSIEIRNLSYTENGDINCEYNHPIYGWIPFTASPNDPEAISRDIYNMAVNSNPKAYVEEEIVITGEMVNAERDWRTAAGFEFNGKMYDFDVRAKADISGAAQMAVNSMMLKGKQPTDDHWHGGEDPFVWIAQDNSMTVMDAITTLQFGETAARHQSAHIFAARALKDMNPIPTDYVDDKYWP